MMAAAGAERRACGELSVAGLAVALDLGALREVLPLRELVPLPSRCAAVLGALDLRGTLLPVLDLGALLGRAPDAAPASCVVVVVHQGRLLGLLAQAVQGVFETEPGSERAAAYPGHGLALLAASLRRADTGRMLQRLDVGCLASLPDVPWIADPEAHRWQADPSSVTPAGRNETATGSEPADEMLTLLRCGPLVLGLDVMAIQATLWAPQLQASPLARGACLGVLAHSGRWLAAVDVLALCGLGALPPGEPVRALVLKGTHGLVALLVSDVLDILRVAPAALVHWHGFGAGHGRPVMRGLLAADAARTGAPGEVLVLDSAAMLAGDLLDSLSRANTPVDAGAGAAVARTGDDAGASAAADQPVLITARLPEEISVPIDEVREILPFQARPAMFGPESPVRHLQVHHGRPLPVVCLRRLTGMGAPPTVGTTAAVLVVDVEGQQVGMAVPELGVIERASWCRPAPRLASGGNGSLSAAMRARRVATLPELDGTERSIPVLDLNALARHALALSMAQAA